MLLNATELLELVHGDAEPERLEELLDRLDRCNESTEAFRVLVTLRAHREEALESLRMAADEHRAPVTPFPHPTQPRAATSSWVLQGLRLAASVAMAAMIGVWVLSSPIATSPPTDFASLATTEPQNTISISPDIQPTAGGDAGIIHEQARILIGERRYEDALEVLEDATADDITYLFRGMAQHLSGNPAEAARTLEPLAASGEDFVSRQARWYQANALLALDRPLEALILLEQLQSREPGRTFYQEAKDLRDQVAALMGIRLTGIREALE